MNDINEEGGERRGVPHSPRPRSRTRPLRFLRSHHALVDTITTDGRKRAKGKIRIIATIGTQDTTDFQKSSYRRAEPDPAVAIKMIAVIKTIISIYGVLTIMFNLMNIAIVAVE